MKKMLCALCMAVLLFCNSFAEETPDLPSMLQEARNGDIESMCDLGLVYFHGKGTLKDPFKAKCWIKKAYDNGSGRAEKLWNDLALWQYSGKCEDSFDDIQEFIRILNAATFEKFSLPTETQWECACRNGGETVNFSWGNESYRPDENCGTCNSGDFHGETSPVGSFPPNDLGLYDMGGNVKEWCRDIYHNDAYSLHKKKNPLYQEKGSSRVVRGGSFSDNTSKLRCTNRDKSIPGMRSDNLGFRLVLTRKN